MPSREQLSEAAPHQELTQFDLWCAEDYAAQLVCEIKVFGKPISNVGSYERQLLQFWSPELLENLPGGEADAA